MKAEDEKDLVREVRDKEGVHGTDVVQMPVPLMLGYWSMSPLSSHLENSTTAKLREMRLGDGPDERPLPEWLDNQP